MPYGFRPYALASYRENRVEAIVSTFENGALVSIAKDSARDSGLGYGVGLEWTFLNVLLRASYEVSTLDAFNNIASGDPTVTKVSAAYRF